MTNPLITDLRTEKARSRRRIRRMLEDDGLRAPSYTRWEKAVAVLAYLGGLYLSLRIGASFWEGI